MRSRRMLVTKDGVRHALPLFLPVYQPREPVFRLASEEIDGCIVNAYFLYKRRELRERLTGPSSLKAHVGFAGLIATDSGAFQGLTRRLYLKNSDIVRFQDRIGSDLISPLDLITPPGDARATALGKMRTTHKRVRQALAIAERGLVAGVQQGGRFLDLRHDSAAHLAELEVEYLAIGSLVPFFNRMHSLAFAGAVLRDARQVVGERVPMHVYGAGEPVELPFMVALGADVFDSSSYAHYAAGGWYMTPYGALAEPGRLMAGEFRCACPHCAGAGRIEAVFTDLETLKAHNLWTICHTVRELRGFLDRGGDLNRHLDELLDIHQRWFPESRLGPTWRALHE